MYNMHTLTNYVLTVPFKGTHHVKLWCTVAFAHLDFALPCLARGSIVVLWLTYLQCYTVAICAVQQAECLVLSLVPSKRGAAVVELRQDGPVGVVWLLDDLQGMFIDNGGKVTFLEPWRTLTRPPWSQWSADVLREQINKPCHKCMLGLHWNTGSLEKNPS